MNVIFIRRRYESSISGLLSMHRIRNRYFYICDAKDGVCIDKLDAPLAVHINVTNKCNLNCHYCYARDAVYDARVMSKEEIFGVLDAINDAGVFAVTWSGGEPYMNENFNEILAYSLKLGMVNTVLTNLTMLDRIDNVSIFHPKCEIQVGLNGIWNDEREQNMDLREVMNNFMLLQQKGARMVATVMIDHKEIDLEKLFEFLTMYTVRRVRFGVLIKQGNMKGFEELIRYREYVKEVTAQLIRSRSKYPEIQQTIQTERITYEQGLFSRRMELCEAGTSQMYINCNGDVFPCPLFKNEPIFLCGNILQQTVKEIWNSENMKSIGSDELMCDQCAKCSNHCGVWCRGLTYSYTRKLSSVSPFCISKEGGF